MVWLHKKTHRRMFVRRWVGIKPESLTYDCELPRHVGTALLQQHLVMPKGRTLIFNLETYSPREAMSRRKKDRRKKGGYRLDTDKAFW